MAVTWPDEVDEVLAGDLTCAAAYLTPAGGAVVSIGLRGGGVHLTVPAGLPQGGRRAGLLAHAYRPQLIGLESRQYTGWLEVSGSAAVYAPHTAAGFTAPPNKTILLLANGFLARRGLARARKSGRAEAVR
ncbi:hypothetical protein ABZ494_06655 [Nocardia amamiensis]